MSTGPLPIGSDAPDFQAQTTEGPIRFHEWLGSSWGVMFSHPKDFTPVCTTELGYMAKIKPEFDKRGVKIIGLSIDPVDRHEGWAKDIAETQGTAPNYPMIGDIDLKVAKMYGMLPAGAGETCEGRTAADNATVRNVYVIGPDKKVKLVLSYPMSTGRNFDEVLRVLDSMQLTAKHKVATPVNWKDGQDVIILPAGQRRRGEAEVSAGLEGAEAVPAHRPAAEVMTRLPVVAVVTLLPDGVGRATGPERGSDWPSRQTRVEGWPQWRGANRDGAGSFSHSLDVA